MRTDPLVQGALRPVSAMALRRAPGLMHLRPACRVEALVFDAVVGLPNPPSANIIAHWTDLTLEQVTKALERLRGRGLVRSAGRVPRKPRGAWMTYRVAEQAAGGWADA